MARTKKRARNSSVELGSPTETTQLTPSGRPTRKGAGKAARRDGFVDSGEIDSDGDPIETPSEDEDGIVVKPARKRKRTPSPTPPPLDPIIRDEEPEDLSSDEASQLHTTADIAKKHAVNLQFNIPVGFHGPLVVKLNRDMLTDTHLGGNILDVQPSATQKKLVVPPKAKAARPGGKTFSDLPPEIRNKIYRQLFVTGEPINIRKASDLCRSGQFLSTCKLVHNEGCSILYGENTIVFERNKYRRGPFWEPDPKEIGYTDVRRFLNMIGPENLEYLRDVKLSLEDASPSGTRGVDSEQRRYSNDDHLADILRTLRGTKLRELTLAFNGRRCLAKGDARFLDFLVQVKADKVVNSDARSYDWLLPGKIPRYLWNQVQKEMTREIKMYPIKK
ncbi:unnamed protein product [Periconia digitata]|uniref:Uncharacterized protein n=1 Tax=Periconia digitata TaxID=1303443 RepID=A0A9W4XN51_9PLEO|nr:unnamed protein product [Periconia digitata]